MLLSAIVLKLRQSNTRFGTRVVGCAQIEDIMENPTQIDTAFVVQLSEGSTRKNNDVGLNQKIIEKFAVIVCLATDSSQKDKTGLTAYDTLYYVRREIFGSILNWLLPYAEEPISYIGGRLLSFNRAFLWYQFEFETSFFITEDDGITFEEGDAFNTLYTEWELAPSDNLPINTGLPVSEFEPDATTIIDFTEES